MQKASSADKFESVINFSTPGSDESHDLRQEEKHEISMDESCDNNRRLFAIPTFEPLVPSSRDETFPC